MNKISTLKGTSFILSSAVLLSIAPKVQANYGTSSTSTTTAAVVCKNESPAKPVFNFVRKVDSDEIEIGWNAVERATSWTVAYGIESGKYIYGAADFGDSNSRSIKISLLPAGTYYIVVKASNGCMPGPFSSERKMTVTSDGRVLGVKTWTQYVLGDKIEATPTSTPSASPSISPSPSPATKVVTVTPTPSPTQTPKRLGIFQRLWIFLFGE